MSGFSVDISSFAGLDGRIDLEHQLDKALSGRALPFYLCDSRHF